MEKLTKELVLERLKAIQNESGDDEVQHGMEDSLNEEFINNIIAGNYESMSEIKEVANAIVKVRDMDFCRWYA